MDIFVLKIEISAQKSVFNLKSTFLCSKLKFRLERVFNLKLTFLCSKFEFWFEKPLWPITAGVEFKIGRFSIEWCYSGHFVIFHDF